MDVKLAKVLHYVQGSRHNGLTTRPSSLFDMQAKVGGDYTL